MSRETLLIVLGVLVAASPYLGMPLSTLATVLPVAGLVVAAIGATQRARNTTPRPVEVLSTYEPQEV
ncbi:MAG TPA: hypothetical protein VF696_02860 [Candidatus Paceibacterota bacterium]|jgi:hypothetical protein